MEPLIKGHEEMDTKGSKVGNVLNVVNAKQQDVPIENVKGGLIIVTEQSDAYLGCNSAMNMGAIPNESLPEGILNVGAIPSNSMSVREFNVGSFSNDDMSANAFNAGILPNHSMLGKASNNSEGKKKQPYSASPASSTHISPPLRPDEVSKRIQGYGNVSNIMQSANMRNTSSKEEKGGGRRRSSSGSIGPPLKSLFLDVGSSLVSGRWMKSSSSNKAPHFDDNPS
ncbi:hypothetical protein GOP47_0008922 [Adiantum capillus-veneris]|uniref:Uncharacterized protein n=1 Tax=Adiantum capillus-veneris TaxID=13818 RepID=A0A9D4V0Q7_ADICA|nr:hypothetical protein GOP47_0008922 [Adiantum capillus-veneris]